MDYIEFTVPTCWDDNKLESWASYKNAECSIGAIYGCRQQQLVGHGRAPDDVPYIDDRHIQKHSKLARKLGIRFLYLLNGNCQHLNFRTETVRNQLISDIEWIVEDVKADAVVVADIRVAKIIRMLYKKEKIGIRVSTIAGVANPEELDSWLEMDVEGIVLHHDVGRDFIRLQKIITAINNKSPNVKLELLVNESCVHGCASRATHYARLSASSLGYVEGFQQTCNLMKLEDPSMLLASNWIRPEDVSIYHEMGISRFKIAGREMPPVWIDRAISAYLSGSYNGNLVDLITMTPPLDNIQASDIFYIDNPSLEGFLFRLRITNQKRKDFYKELAVDLWKAGALKINDPEARYAKSSSGICCATPGKYYVNLAELQSNSDEKDQNRKHFLAIAGKQKNKELAIS